MTRSATVPDIATVESCRRRIAELEDQLRDAQDALEAIRAGEVDAVLVPAAPGVASVYTLAGAERPYRALIEHMREGAMTLTPDGTVLYGNKALADLLGTTPERMVGAFFEGFVAARDRDRFEVVARGLGRGEVRLTPERGKDVQVQVSFVDLREDGDPVLGCVVTDLTEARRHGRELARAEARHAADQAVREREALYRLVLESATDYAIIATDLEGTITLWNTGARNILGWEEAEIVGQPAPLIWTEEDRAAGAPETEMRGARNDGRAEDERWHLRKDGSRFWAHGLLMPLLDDDGGLIGYLKILRDRTSQREAEEASRATQERYRLAARATNDAMRDWDISRNAVGWNEALQEAYGHAPVDVEPTGDWWIAHIHPEDRGRIDASIHAAIDGTGTTWSDEYRFLRADGSYADVLDRGFVIRDGDGRAVRMIAAMLDLTEQRRAYKARQASEASLRAVLDTVPVGILFAEAPTGRIVGGNRRIDEILRHPILPSPAIENYGDWVAFHADGRQVEPAEYPLTRIIREGLEHAELECEYLRGDGTRVWVEIVGAPMRDEAGERTGAVVTIADIAERKRAAAHQDLLNHELSHRMKNLLAMVQAIAASTLRGATDMDAAREVLGDRLVALGKAHDVLLGGAPSARRSAPWCGRAWACSKARRTASSSRGPTSRSAAGRRCPWR